MTSECMGRTKAKEGERLFFTAIRCPVFHQISSVGDTHFQRRPTAVAAVEGVRRDILCAGSPGRSTHFSQPGSACVVFHTRIQVGI